MTAKVGASNGTKTKRKYMGRKHTMQDLLSVIKLRLFKGVGVGKWNTIQEIAVSVDTDWATAKKYLKILVMLGVAEERLIIITDCLKRREYRLKR